MSVDLGIGTRLHDFTTGSWALFQNPQRRLVQVNVTAHDAYKARSIAVQGDARTVVEALRERLGGSRTGEAWTARISTGLIRAAGSAWRATGASR
jgi:3D-(3,5/4)-trihydroxycyclohexane-1,2-dione acylhydrolase (decyclizing)